MRTRMWLPRLMGRLIDPTERPWTFRLVYGSLLTLWWAGTYHYWEHHRYLSSHHPKDWTASILIGAVGGAVAVAFAELQVRADR